MAERLEANFGELSAERDTLRGFITDASHEIRIPITALKNFNELMLGKAGENPDIRKEFLTESKTQIDRLEWITVNLLEISRLDAGLTPLKNETIHVINLIELALSNFIENSLKFTPADGEVEIGTDKTNEKIYIWVRDTGPGISPKDLPHIFERFYRGRNSIVEGSDLGLAMVKSIVSAHNGEVKVISDLDSGSEFRIILPTDTNNNECF